MSKRVLLTNWDPVVLRTRKLIIESAGYDVFTTRDLKAFLDLFRNQDFDATVIGASIPLTLRQKLTVNMKIVKPRTPVIVFCWTAAEAQQLVEADHRVEALGPPEQFLMVLRTALGDAESAPVPSHCNSTSHGAGSRAAAASQSSKPHHARPT